MAIFGKKCAICGKPSGILSRTIADKNKICDKCWAEAFGSFNTPDFSWHERPEDIAAITPEIYQLLLEEREENRERLETFTVSKNLSHCILIDDIDDCIVFYPHTGSLNKERLLRDNPHVFEATDLALADVFFGEKKEGTTVTGSAKVESTQTMVFGFDEPYRRLFTLKLPNLTATSGFFGDKVKGTDKRNEIFDAILELKEHVKDETDSEGNPLPVNSIDSYFTLLSQARRMNLITDKDVKETLNNMFGKDRALIKSVRKRFDL